MNNEQKPNVTEPAEQAPSPEVLQPQSTSAEATTVDTTEKKPATKLRRGSYRPSHKATFIGLAVVGAILAINAAVIMFVIRGQTDKQLAAVKGDVTLSSAVLDGLGVSRSAIENQGTELTVGPNSKFKGTVTIAKDVSIAGQLRLNSKFSANEASLTKLQAGDVAINQININGDATASTLNLRKDIAVAGATRLQGPVTISQLTTINNSLNVGGNLAVGGTLSARTFQANSLVSETTLTIGGHVLTHGSAPGVSGGSGVGSNGTVSISGNDTAGTVAFNTGVGAGNGTVATISFASRYATTPHVVVTPIGGGISSFYVSRSSSGFSIGVNGSVSPGGYAFDYIVMQ